MSLRPERLPATLQQGLAPVYLVAGDEPLLLMECADQIRAAARAAGFEERVVHHAERGFNWGTLHQSGASLSLFAERRIIELRLSSAKPGKAGGEALTAYAAAPPPDTVLLITAPKLDRSTLSTRWVKAIGAAGVVVQVWPVADAEFASWLNQRMRGRGLAPDRDTTLALAARVEGNLLAAAQEIDKLWLNLGEGPVGVDDVERNVSDSSRFSVFKLADAAVAGHLGRALKVLGALRQEGIEPVLIAWALTREVRALAAMRRLLDAGQDMRQVLSAGRVWSNRQGPVRAALGRHSSESLLALLADCEALDASVKGRSARPPWDAALAVTTRLAARPDDLAASA